MIAAIAKRYVKELIATATAPANPAFRAIAYQFGHDPIALNNNYGLDLSYPEKLQPELIASYERTSACWHQWLQLADFEHELLQPTGTAAAAVAVAAASSLPPLLPRKRKQDTELVTQGRLAKQGRFDMPNEVREALRVLTNFLS